ncbi:hypothetical protein M5689_001341 [Euphorbia peplus]|nr:hypothetical protein M5689_001341 [Euphorbia peplus]
MKDSIIDCSFSEEKWARKMKSLLNKQNCQEFENSISVFQVSKPVKSIKPEAYTPHFIALGPYHNFHPYLYKFQKFKLYQAQIIHQEFNLPDFIILSQQIETKVVDIKSYYNDHLEITDETLSWMMVIDGLFLLRLIYKAESESDFFDESGRKFSMDSILKDVTMIENQIPFFVLEHLVARHHSNSPSIIIKPLLVMSIKICSRTSPISLHGKFLKHDFIYPFHLLDLMYNLVLFGGIPPGLEDEFHHSGGSIWDKIFRLLGTIPASEEEKDLIPDASQLSGVKVNFIGGIGIKFISFRQADASLHLPILTLNSYSDVVIRNLIAYEAVTKPESQDFARYIEIMAAMIRSLEDVELLRSKGILKHEGDCGEIVKLFKAISLSCAGKSELLDEVIKEINQYYDSNWRIKLKRVLKKYVYSSWKMFTVFATMWLLLLTTIQTFCSVYSCPGLVNTRFDFHLFTTR